MPKRMLIDSSHPEETRVVVLDGQKVEEFDFEAASKRPLKGNIYLAKVTRVEPSLQAAFVEYGGNRQGFLAFSEIHPDYYQIPVADRMALLAEQEAEARRRSDDEFESFDTVAVPAQSATGARDTESVPDENGGRSTEDAEQGEMSEFSADHDGDTSDSERHDDEGAEEASDVSGAAEFQSPETGGELADPNEAQQSGAQAAQRPTQRWVRRRHYKIQEVIKRRQVILVQVVKEERGNKGAALTTYLSLAGRYCVLMPNTPRGGGISRKITNANDRKRLKSAAQALELPEGMGLIIRTAGENRTKVEIKRDYEYLLRMWDTIREITLKSNAPACVYEEGDLIKRAIRDLYNKDVSEVLVEGEDGYRNAKDFMRMLMPSHAKNVKPYKEAIPLYQRLHIEAQLDAMFSPTVTLKSGGYVVINQTEALVAVDVNSGRATREHSIEDTAYKTNLEAAEEVARQLRLRDLAGLIVIDFIDMEDARNDRNVEKRLRDCIKNDRARVQIGKISQFGLLEMSRQRLRAGVVAGSTVTCPTCAGQGIVRSVESTALRVLRALDEEGQRQRANTLVVNLAIDVAMYTLNQKRRELARMEQDYGVTVVFQPKDDIQAGNFELERIGERAPDEKPRAVLPPLEEPVHAPHTSDPEDSEVEEESAPEEHDGAEAVETANSGQTNGENGGRRRRRRRRRGRDRAPQQDAQQQQPTSAAAAGTDETDDEDDETEPSTGPQTGDGSESPVETSGTSDGGKRKRRRRRRGRRGPREGNLLDAQGESEAAPEVSGGDGAIANSTQVEPATEEIAGAPETALPNAPSEPVWSLFPERHDEVVPIIAPATPEPAQNVLVPADQPLADPIADNIPIPAPIEPGAIAVAPPSGEVLRQKEEEGAAPEPQAEQTSADPERTNRGEARQGWWQRPFRARE